MSEKEIGVWRGGLGNEATRHKVISRLQQYRELGPPALLFLASHGYETKNVALRPQFQGSWIPQGAPALAENSSLDQIKQNLLTGYDFCSGGLSPLGSVVFNFSCFGAGLHQEFTLRRMFLDDEIGQDDPNPQVGTLGQSLLGNPRPALAYISTLDRKTNVFSLYSDGFDRFEEFTRLLVKGKEIGQAIQLFWEESEILDDSARQLLEEAIQKGISYQDLPDEKARTLAINWFTAEEFKNFVILGDPKICLNPLI